MSNPLLEAGYQYLFTACRKVRPEVRAGLYAFGLAVSPAIAVSDESARQRRPLLTGTLKLMPLVLIFSLGFNLLFSAMAGRLLPDGDASTINFFEDSWNLALYLLVCPVYVSLSLQIIMISSRYENPPPVGGREPSRLDNVRSPIALILAIGLAAVFAANYILDVAIGPDGHSYWFNDRVGAIRVLNGAGIYYSVMTFGFLFVTILAALNYLSIAQTTVTLARSVTAQDCRNLAAMQSAFLRFSHAFVLARWLIATFMLHTVIWSRSPLAKTENIHIAGALLVLAAFVLTAVPSRYIERKVAAAAAECGQDPGALGIMPPGAKKWLQVADGIIGLGFMSALWGWEPVSDLMTPLFGARQL